MLQAFASGSQVSVLEALLAATARTSLEVGLAGGHAQGNSRQLGFYAAEGSCLARFNRCLDWTAHDKDTEETSLAVRYAIET